MTPRERNRYLEALQRRREEAARQEQPEEASETNEPRPSEAKVLVDRPVALWPTRPARRPWK